MFLVTFASKISRSVLLTTCCSSSTFLERILNFNVALFRKEPYYFVKVRLYLVLLLQDSNQNYSEMEEELLKTEEEPAENEPESLQNDDSSSQKNEKITAINITREQVLPICEKLGDSWKKLGMKFGFNDHEISFYESENPTDQLRATHMLQVWFKDDDNATLENLSYILEGLGLNDVSELIKNEYINNS